MTLIETGNVRVKLHWGVYA